MIEFLSYALAFGLLYVTHATFGLAGLAALVGAALVFHVVYRALRGRWMDPL